VRSLRACLTVLVIRGRKARNPWASNCISVPTSRRGSEWTTYQRSVSFNTNGSRPRRHGSLSSEAGPPNAIQKPCCDTTSPLVSCRPHLLFWGQSFQFPLAQCACCRTPAGRCGALLPHAVNHCLWLLTRISTIRQNGGESSVWTDKDRRQNPARSASRTEPAAGVVLRTQLILQRSHQVQENGIGAS
jgi:hypothetical protein